MSFGAPVAVNDEGASLALGFNPAGYLLEIDENKLVWLERRETDWQVYQA